MFKEFLHSKFQGNVNVYENDRRNSSPIHNNDQNGIQIINPNERVIGEKNFILKSNIKKKFF